uniref:Uncharacterized protein n=1 Tax=Peronospora matthiolae TaxID=2874970 RepID=A0AAV1UP43_9STRA
MLVLDPADRSPIEDLTESRLKELIDEYVCVVELPPELDPRLFTSLYRKEIRDYPEISYNLHLGCSYRLGDYVKVDSETKVSCYCHRNIAVNPWY